MSIKKSRSQISKSLKLALRILQNRGFRPEDIASAMNVSYNSIKSWEAGRRFPRVTTLRHMENVFKMRIL